MYAGEAEKGEAGEAGSGGEAEGRSWLISVELDELGSASAPGVWGAVDCGVASAAMSSGWLCESTSEDRRGMREMGRGRAHGRRVALPVHPYVYRHTRVRAATAMHAHTRQPIRSR